MSGPSSTIPSELVFPVGDWSPSSAFVADAGGHTYDDVVTRVKARLDRMLLLQADVTGNTREHKALLKRFHLFGPPGIIFFDANGRELKGLRVIGYQSAERFLKTLDLAEVP